MKLFNSEKMILDSGKSALDVKVVVEVVHSSYKNQVKASRMKSTKPQTQNLFPKIEKLIEVYFKSEPFEGRHNAEFKELITTYKKIQKITEKNSSGRVISFSKFTNSLVKYLDPENQESNSSLKTLILRIFRQYIESDISRVEHRG